jgi:hypothetical protein
VLPEQARRGGAAPVPEPVQGAPAHDYRLL